MTTVVYLHGFLSSPQSEKAQLTKAFFEQYYPDVKLVIPELPNQPQDLRGVLERLITQEKLAIGDGVRVIGSSMGGYLATWLVESCGGKAVCINPAVKPYELLTDYYGDHVNPYTGVAFTLAKGDMGIIATLDTPELRDPSAYKVLLQTGDETLDYKQAKMKYEGGDVTVEVGGNHSFMNYADHLPQIARFLLSQ